MGRAKLKWVHGNYLKLAIPLETETVDGGVVITSPYKVPEGSEITVSLIGRLNRRTFSDVSPVTVYEGTDHEQSVLYIEDNGTLPQDVYGVEVTVSSSSGIHLRSMWREVLEIICDNSGKLEEFNDFIGDDSVELDAAVFYSCDKVINADDIIKPMLNAMQTAGFFSSYTMTYNAVTKKYEFSFTQ